MKLFCRSLRVAVTELARGVVCVCVLQVTGIPVLLDGYSNSNQETEGPAFTGVRCSYSVDIFVYVLNVRYDTILAHCCGSHQPQIREVAL